MFSVVRPALLVMALVGAGAVVASDIHRELDDISKRLATKIEESRRTKVAVADFTDLDGNQRQIGRFISEELSTNLVLSARGYSVIDRNHLRTILREQKLSMSGLMDPENQKKIGKILGVDALILGSINPFGEQYRITFKVVATDTAEVVAADRGMVPKTPATDQLWETIIRDESAVGTASAPTQQTSSASRSAGVPEIVSQPRKGEYGSQYLTFAIESLGVSKDKKSATLVGRLTNVSKQDIYVAAHPDEKDDQGVSMVDDTGGLWVRTAMVGMTTYPHSSSHMMQYRGATQPGQGAAYNINNFFTLLTPGQSQPVNVAFKPVGSIGDPKIFSFSANLYLRAPAAEQSGKPSGGQEAGESWRYTSTAIGISGIKLQ